MAEYRLYLDDNGAGRTARSSPRPGGRRTGWRSGNPTWRAGRLEERPLAEIRLARQRCTQGVPANLDVAFGGPVK